MWFQDLGLIPYNDAWALQLQAHEKVQQGGEEGVFLLEHTPVITFGRRGETPTLLVSKDQLAFQGVELVQSDRGGDVTFHGPGQLVAYPIIRLQSHNLTVGAYVKILEHAVIHCLKNWNIDAFLDPGAIGVWVKAPDGQTAKICALGVRIKGGVSLHGIALNLGPDLNYFSLINPCGLGRPVCSLKSLLADRAPSMSQLKSRLVQELRKSLSKPL